MAPPVSGYVAWYDASDTATITESGGAVSQWDDKSGNGYHLTQSTAGIKPTTGTQTINSLNVLDFDGGDQLVSSTLPGSPAARTVFALVKPTNFSAVRPILGNTGVGTGNFELRFGTDGKPNLLKQGVAFIAGGTSGVTAATAVLVTAKFVNGSSYAFWTDGTANGSGSHAVSLTAGQRNDIGVEEGGAARFLGQIAELVIYDSALVDADRESVEDYLADKWLQSTITGAGALTGGAGTLSGAGTLTISGVGTLTGGAGTLAGAGTETIDGAGALVGVAGLLAGAGTETITGVGALVGAAGLLSGFGGDTPGTTTGTFTLTGTTTGTFAPTGTTTGVFGP